MIIWVKVSLEIDNVVYVGDMDNVDNMDNCFIFDKMNFGKDDLYYIVFLRVCRWSVDLCFF